jgi:hypothetical protein
LHQFIKVVPRELGSKGKVQFPFSYTVVTVITITPSRSRRTTTTRTTKRCDCCSQQNCDPQLLCCDKIKEESCNHIKARHYFPSYSSQDKQKFSEQKHRLYTILSWQHLGHVTFLKRLYDIIIFWLAHRGPTTKVALADESLAVRGACVVRHAILSRRSHVFVVPLRRRGKRKGCISLQIHIKYTFRTVLVDSTYVNKPDQHSKLVFILRQQVLEN